MHLPPYTDTNKLGALLAVLMGKLTSRRAGGGGGRRRRLSGAAGKLLNRISEIIELVGPNWPQIATVWPIGSKRWRNWGRLKKKYEKKYSKQPEYEPW